MPKVQVSPKSGVIILLKDARELPWFKTLLDWFESVEIDRINNWGEAELKLYVVLVFEDNARDCEMLLQMIHNAGGIIKPCHPDAVAKADDLMEIELR